MSFVSSPLWAALQAQYGNTPAIDPAVAAEAQALGVTPEEYMASLRQQQEQARAYGPRVNVEGLGSVPADITPKEINEAYASNAQMTAEALERAKAAAFAADTQSAGPPLELAANPFPSPAATPAEPPPLAVNGPGSQLPPGTQPPQGNFIGREAMNLPQSPAGGVNVSGGGRVSMPVADPNAVAQIPAGIAAGMRGQTQTNIARQADAMTRQQIATDEAAQRKSAFTLGEVVPQLNEKTRLIRAQADAIQRIQDETNAAVQGAMDRIESGRQFIKANPVNMGRVFSGTQGTLAAIGAAIATGVGEAVAIQTGRPNSQANLIMDLIQRDVAGQEKLLESERANIAEQYTAIGQLRQQGMDKQSARQAATLASIDAVQAQIETAIAQFQGTEDVNGLQIMWEQMEQQKLQMQQDRMMQLYNAQAPYTDMQVRALTQRMMMEADAAAKQAELTVPGATGLLANKENRTEANALVGAYHSIQPMLKQYVEALADPALGGVEWSALAPGDPARLAVESQLTQLHAALGAAQAGLGLKQQTKDEFEKLTRQLLPSPTDAFVSREAALEAARTALRNFENSSKAYMKPLMRGFTGFSDMDAQNVTLKQQITGRQQAK